MGFCFKSEKEVDAGSPSAMAEQCDAVRIATEGSNVFIEPMQGSNLVHETIVCNGTLVRHRVCVQETCK